MDTFTFTFTPPHDGLINLAQRFSTTEDCIQHLSRAARELAHATGDDARAAHFAWADHWQVRIELTNLLKDGDLAIVPVPHDKLVLPAGARWVEWEIPENTTTDALVAMFQSATPIGRLIPGSPRQLAWMLQEYYRNANIRRLTLKAGANDYHFHEAILPAGETIFLPVDPPLRQSIQVAPSPLAPASKPPTAATVDVGAGRKYAELLRALHEIDRILGSIDRMRAELVTIKQTGKAVWRNFVELKEVMEKTNERFTSALRAMGSVGGFLPGHEPEPDDVKRKEAIESIEKLIDAAKDTLLAEDAWKRYYPHAPASIAAACDELKTALADTNRMALLAELMPTSFGLPVNLSERSRVTCTEYVSHLATRAAIALANSPNEGDWKAIADLVKSTKQAGAGCANLIEYAVSMTRGFDDGMGIPPSTAPFSLKGVLITLACGHTVKEAVTEKGEAAGGRGAGVARTLLATVFSDIKPLLDAAGVTSEGELSEDLAEIKERYEAYAATKEGFSSAQDALELGGMKKGHAFKLLDSVLHPFNEDGPFRDAIPKGARGFFEMTAAVYELAGKSGETLSSLHEGAENSISAKGLFDMESKLADTGKAGLEAGKAVLEFFEIESSFNEAAETLVKLLGPAGFILGAIVEGFEVVDAAEAKDYKGVAGHAALGGSSICFLVGAAAGASLFVGIGVVLLVGGLVATKGKLVVQFLKGETLAKYKAVCESSATTRWCTDFGIGAQLAAFKAAFDEADFDEGHAGDMQARAKSLQMSRN